MVSMMKKKMRIGSSKKQKEEERWFLENGSIFLKELIADYNGKSIPIRSFSSSQILKATNNFDSSCFVSAEGDHKWYKGIIKDKSYLIKRCAEYRVIERRDGEAYNDMVLSARMSSHNNFLKLFGCCLEFSFPVFVFEYAEHVMVNGEDFILPWNIRLKIVKDDSPLLSWNVRLKIAKEVATAITYLHTAFPRIIIHRDIKPRNVFLDKNRNAKLSGFSLSVTLPEGKSWIEDDVTEYTDVFSFGILMLVILMGRPAVFAGSNGVHCNILDYVKDLQERGESVEFGDHTIDMRSGEMKMFLELALRCCEKRNEDRPKMIVVVKELIERSLDC